VSFQQNGSMASSPSPAVPAANPMPHERAAQLEAARQAVERAKTALHAAELRGRGARDRVAAGSPATVLAAAEAEVAAHAQHLLAVCEHHQQLQIQDIRTSYRERQAEHTAHLAQYRTDEAERERLAAQIQTLKGQLVAMEHRLAWLERHTECGLPSGAALRAFAVQHREVLRAAGDLSQEEWEQLTR